MNDCFQHAPHPNCKCCLALSPADLVVIEAEAIVAAAGGWGV